MIGCLEPPVSYVCVWRGGGGGCLIVFSKRLERNGAPKEGRARGREFWRFTNCNAFWREFWQFTNYCNASWGEFWQFTHYCNASWGQYWHSLLVVRLGESFCDSLIVMRLGVGDGGLIASRACVFLCVCFFVLFFVGVWVGEWVRLVM